jgi:ribosomal protein S15P/S13E
LEISLEIQEDKTDVIEDQVANLTEQITELKQQVKQMYGDEEDWKRMSKT